MSSIHTTFSVAVCTNQGANLDATGCMQDCSLSKQRRALRGYGGSAERQPCRRPATSSSLIASIARPLRGFALQTRRYRTAQCQFDGLRAPHQI